MRRIGDNSESPAQLRIEVHNLQYSDFRKLSFWVNADNAVKVRRKLGDVSDVFWSLLFPESAEFTAA